ncbi:hypothetical protein C2S51_037724 [Perilla frutescens var. frutescens]|nr:hypothetical protein C2S51_037724 [Perilla frutescens var. frutescens]
MEETESIGEFNARLRNISNESFALGEAKDIKSMRLDELMGSLRTFKMNLEDEGSSSRKKGITLKTEVSEDVPDNPTSSLQEGPTTEDNLLETLCKKEIPTTIRRSINSPIQEGKYNAENMMDLATFKLNVPTH